jgi:hypothetical protein
MSAYLFQSLHKDFVLERSSIVRYTSWVKNDVNQFGPHLFDVDYS